MRIKKSNLYWPISIWYFAYALANHRPELIKGDSVSESAARIQMMNHHLPCSSDFHDILLVPVSVHSHCTCYIF